MSKNNSSFDFGDFLLLVGCVGIIALVATPVIRTSWAKNHQGESNASAEGLNNYAWVTIGTKVTIDGTNFKGIVKEVIQPDSVKSVKYLYNNDALRPHAIVLYTDGAGRAIEGDFDVKLLSQGL